MNSTIKGTDFVLNADLIFKTDDYDFIDSDIVANCMNATKKYRYDEKRNKTDEQQGWNYEVYVAKRKLVINIAVDDLKCAYDFDDEELQKIKFTNFRATFYVNNRGFLSLSCKAEKAEKAGN